MSLVPSPSAVRGDLTLQPTYFTSSLFVIPFRADIEHLTNTFIKEYTTDVTQPFALFKRIWQDQGWTWMHLKVFDARTRHVYLTVACRLFIERFAEHIEPLRKLVALFGLYTFYFTQPSSSRIPLYLLRHVDIAIDQYDLLLKLPKAVSPTLATYASQVVSALQNASVFYVLPMSRLEPYNPRVLPREVYVEDEEETVQRTGSTRFPTESELDLPVSGSSGTQEDGMASAKVPKKKGRPSKQTIAKRTKDAVAGLDRWLERTDSVGRAASGSGTGPSRARGHALLSHAPTVSRANYRAQKTQVLGALKEQEGGEGMEALERANVAVLGRLKKIDAMAAEKGMEVGGEGGELTGLGRVERAAERGGILSLMEGAGSER